MSHRLPAATALLACLYLTHCLPASAEEAARLVAEAQTAADRGEWQQAVKLASQAIAADAKLSTAYYVRGRAHFQAGEIKQSVADFDRYVKLRPDRESRQWERGISLYYAGEYQRGADQFQLYQTFHDNDVENSTWRYLCLAKISGVKKARTTMLPIKNDRRVPMMQIYQMYRGELTPEEVLAACKVGDPAKEVLAGRLFYARLYLGLYYDSLGKDDLARRYLLLAADEHKETQTVNRYMYDVARIHADMIRREKKAPQKGSE
ncbi:MAG TPA: hypothetical protein DCY79_11050 [Planctomycetaceae bacterium]|nr:hypothetical protein [Blastopirellula sp.]HAY80333.1 hypothetical protein [Planctomycetaceae bacterium]